MTFAGDIIESQATFGAECRGSVKREISKAGAQAQCVEVKAERRATS